MPPGHDRNVIYTYRYLRVAMIALLLMLVFSVAYQWWMESGRTCWLGSISAYYFTPARTIFVGSLCALGVCLIAYKGHTPEEDVLLDFSGFMAFVVAMVPTVPDSLCGPNAYSQTLPEIGSAVRNNIWSLIVATVIALIIRRLLRPRAAASDTPTRRGWLIVMVSVACAAVLAIELVLFLILRERFIEVSHNVAAVTMVVGVIGVMVFSALRGEVPRHYKGIYLAIAAALLFALVGALVVAALTNFDHLTLWVELAVIVLFGAYWGVQTRELWNLTEPMTTIASVAAEPRRARPDAEAPTTAEDDGPVQQSPAPATPSAPAPDAAAVEGRVADTVAQ